MIQNDRLQAQLELLQVRDVPQGREPADVELEVLHALQLPAALAEVGDVTLRRAVVTSTIGGQALRGEIQQ